MTSIEFFLWGHNSTHNSLLLFIYLKKIYFLYFKFWGTCADLAGLLHRYTHAMVVCGLHPLSPTLGISPVIPPQSSQPPAVPPLVPHPQQTPVCDVPLPVSMCSHCSTPTYEREHVVFDFLFFWVCWEWWFPASSMSLQRTWTHPFLQLHSIPRCICATSFHVLIGHFYIFGEMSNKILCPFLKLFLSWVFIGYDPQIFSPIL